MPVLQNVKRQSQVKQTDRPVGIAVIPSPRGVEGKKRTFARPIIVESFLHTTGQSESMGWLASVVGSDKIS